MRRVLLVRLTTTTGSSGHWRAGRPGRRGTERGARAVMWSSLGFTLPFLRGSRRGGRVAPGSAVGRRAGKPGRGAEAGTAIHGGEAGWRDKIRGTIRGREVLDGTWHGRRTRRLMRPTVSFSTRGVSKADGGRRAMVGIRDERHAQDAFEVMVRLAREVDRSSTPRRQLGCDHEQSVGLPGWAGSVRTTSLTTTWPSASTVAQGRTFASRSSAIASPQSTKVLSGLFGPVEPTFDQPLVSERGMEPARIRDE